jgi:hypothetical protein
VSPTLAFGGGVADSVFSPIAFALTLLAGILVCVLPRNKAIVPFLLAAILIPVDQVLVIFSVHFGMLRIMAIFGLLRVIWGKFSQGEKIFSGGMNVIDKAMILFGVFGAIDGILLWQAWGEVVFEAGTLTTLFGVYLLLRYLIRDEDDMKRTLRVWTCVAVVVAVVMTCEQLTGQNPVTIFLGGAHAQYHSTVDVRQGSMRATGVFDHPILAGTFGGISLPLFVGLWWKEKKHRIYPAMGIVACSVIPLLASSSTAMMGFIAGIGALCFWRLRRHMRAIRWAIVGLIIADELRFKQHFWHIITDVDLTGSSSSWHRYMLIDECVKHFWNWALIGTKEFASWGWEMMDLSNQYVATADTSGLIPLLSLAAIIVFGYKYLGRARLAADTAGDTSQELFIWALASSLFANCIAFIGISYFDQTSVAWYALLAMISAITAQLGAQNSTITAEGIAEPNFMLHPSLASGPIRNSPSRPVTKTGLPLRK